MITYQENTWTPCEKHNTKSPIFVQNYKSHSNIKHIHQENLAACFLDFSYVIWRSFLEAQVNKPS